MNGSRLLYLIVITLTRIFVKIFYRHKTFGSHNFQSKRAIIVSNHTSYLDPPLVAASAPENIHFLARSTLFRSIFGGFISALNAHPIKRGGVNISAVKDICKLVKRGKKVLIFPEGKRSKDGGLLPLQPGVGIIASLSAADIIPVYIEGAYDIWSSSRGFPKLFGKTTAVIGQPITWSGFSKMDKKEAQVKIVKAISSKLSSLEKWSKEGKTGIIP